MAKKAWYTELHDANGRAAKWWAMLPDLAAVRGVVMAAREKGEQEIVRVIPPLDAARYDLDALEKLARSGYNSKIS
jgi:hypothetical protein